VENLLLGWPMVCMDQSEIEKADAELCKRFAAHVRRLRRASDKSQEQLAEDAGVHRTYISSLERSGQRNPTISVATRIASALGVSLSDLLD
tara:strand:+ start:759 stop:1031 length:273 start_codon:yes stop_codon:yes gene_type:complete